MVRIQIENFDVDSNIRSLTNMYGTVRLLRFIPAIKLLNGPEEENFNLCSFSECNLGEDTGSSASLKHFLMGNNADTLRPGFL